MLPLLTFRAVLHSKPWGGDALWHRLGKGQPTDTHMGESWELSDRPEGMSTVSGGPLAGRTLRDLLATDGAAILGDVRGDGGDGSDGGMRDNRAEHAGSPHVSGDVSFPLLYKFIAAREKLSVQVHPGADSPLGEAKTECWYVVDAAPDASLIVGVSPGGRTRDETLALLRSPDCETVLQRLPARPGDTFFIPAGTVHAITEGLLLYELQQNSDTTFRLYDWGRVDAAGNPRALHLDEAAQVSDTTPREGYHIAPLRVPRATHDEDFLVACKYFALTKWRGFKAPAMLLTEGRFRVVTVAAGAVTLRDAQGRVTPASRGDTLLVPACHATVIIEATPDAELLVSFVPDLERAVRAPLRAAGHADAAIDALSGPRGVAY